MATPAAVLEILVNANTHNATSNLRKVDEQAHMTSGSLGKLAKAAVAMGGAFVAFNAAKDAIKTTEDLGLASLKLSKTTGMDIKTSSQWIEVMKVRGLASKSTSMAFITLSRNIRNAEEGSKSAKKAFQELGVSQDDLKKSNTAQTLKLVADGLKNVEAPAQRAAIAQQLFGRGAQALIPVLSEGRKGIDDMLKAANRYGAFLPDNVAKIKGAIDAQHNLNLAMDGLKISFTEAVLPMLVQGAQKLLAFIKQMRDGKGAGGEFAAAIKSSFNTVKTVVGNVISNVGGLGNAIKIALAAFAVSKVVAFAKALRALFLLIETNPIGAFLTVVGLLAGAFLTLSGNQAQAATTARDVADAWRKAAGAAKDLRDKNLNLLQAQLDHIDAQNRLKEAVKAAEKAQDQYGKKSPQYAAAEDEVAHAKLDVKAAANTETDALHAQSKANDQVHQTTRKAIGIEAQHVESMSKVYDQMKKNGATHAQLHGQEVRIQTAEQKMWHDWSNMVVNQSRHANQGLAEWYQSGADAVRNSMNAGTTSFKKGLAMINRLMIAAFKQLGIDPKTAAKLASQGWSVSAVAGAQNSINSSGVQGAGFARGGMVDRPGYFAGEEAPTHPEVILATNPAYRQRNVGLWAKAGSMLGIPGFAKGDIWNVRASAEQASSGRGWTELSPNGNAAARLGIPQNFANSASHWPDFASLGKMYPRGTLLNIAANGRRGTFPMTDVGDGSSFAPAIGLTPAVQAALGGMPSTVNISLASGAPLHPFPGMAQLVSGSGGLSGLGGVAAPTIPAVKVGGRGLIPALVQGMVNAVRNAGNKRLSMLAAALTPAVSGGAGGGPFFPIAPGPVPRQVQWALSAAESIAARHPAYGHLGAGWGLSAYDCSSYVSTVMDAAGIWPKWAYYTAAGPINAHTQPGHGKWITIATRGTSGNDAHTMMEINGRFFESSHTGVGPHQDSGWSEAFDQYRHPAGFAKGGISLGKIGHQPTQAQADMIQAARRKAGGARLWDANGDLAFANGGIHGSPPPPPREAAGRIGRGGGRVPPVGPSENRTFHNLARRTWDRLSRSRDLPAWAHMPGVLVQRAGYGGFGPYSRPYTLGGQVHFPWNAVHYALSPGNSYSDWAREAIVHEFAHTMQNPKTRFDPTHYLTEGGAQAWADERAPGAYAGTNYRNPGDSSYGRYVNWVRRHKGWDWINHGQFARRREGGVFPFAGSFHQGGIVPHDGMALVQRGEAIIPGYKKGGIPSLPVIDAEITKTQATIKSLRDALAGKPDKAHKKSLDKQLKDAQATLAKEKTQQTAALAYLTHIPSQATPQQVSATSIANRLQAAINAGNIPGQARALTSELTLDRKWLAADKAKLRKINKLLSRRGLSRSQRGALIQDKLALLQEIGSVQSDIGSVESSLGQILTGDGTTGGAGGGDPNQPLIDAMNAQAQAMKDLQASLDTQTHYMQSVGEIEKRQAIKALSDMISGQISGQFQSRSTGSAGDGSVARYGSVARA